MTQFSIILHLCELCHCETLTISVVCYIIDNLINSLLIINRVRVQFFHEQILGCTAPQIRCADAVIYVGDGRFHLEAVMIANPTIRAFRYDPYDKKLTEEFYEHEQMRRTRREAIEIASKANTIGLVLGTLGRQGNPNVLKSLQRRIDTLGKQSVVILLSEIFPDKISMFDGIDAFIQVFIFPQIS